MKAFAIFISIFPLLLHALPKKSTVKFVISKDKGSVEKTEKNRVLKTYKVIAKCGAPFVGKPEIRSISVDSKKVRVTYGKHDFAEIDILTDGLNCLGAD